MTGKKVCKGYNRISFKPCMVWAAKGSDYCRIHTIRMAKAAVLINLEQQLAAAQVELDGVQHSFQMLAKEISEQREASENYRALIQRQAAAARRQMLGCETVVLNLKHELKQAMKEAI